MLKVLMHMHKMSAICCQFAEHGMMGCTTSLYMASIMFKDNADSQNAAACVDEDDNDLSAFAGTPPASSYTDIKLFSCILCINIFILYYIPYLISLTVRR